MSAVEPLDQLLGHYGLRLTGSLLAPLVLLRVAMLGEVLIARLLERRSIGVARLVLRNVLLAFESPPLVPKVTLRQFAVWIPGDGNEHTISGSPGFNQAFLFVIGELQ